MCKKKKKATPVPLRPSSTVYCSAMQFEGKRLIPYQDLVTELGFHDQLAIMHCETSQWQPHQCCPNNAGTKQAMLHSAKAQLTQDYNFGKACTTHFVPE